VRFPTALVDQLHAYAGSRNETISDTVISLFSDALNQLPEMYEKSLMANKPIKTLRQNAHWLNG
jgi:hypothetical protein